MCVYCKTNLFNRYMSYHQKNLKPEKSFTLILQTIRFPVRITNQQRIQQSTKPLRMLYNQNNNICGFRFKSEKTGRGPLIGNEWQKSVDPVMTCYKLVTCEFKWFGLQSRIESFIQKSERRLFTTFHR